VASRVTTALRQATAILCMALAIMLSFQAYIGLMDRMDHARNIEHFPNPLAGDVEYCSGPMGICTDDTSTHHDPLMHHHGDAAIMFLAAQFFVLPACTTVERRCVSMPTDFLNEAPLAPDRPPKHRLENRV
jgi:hypothetical protein